MATSTQGQRSKETYVEVADLNWCVKFCEGRSNKSLCENRKMAKF